MEKLEEFIRLVESEFGECAVWRPVSEAAKLELQRIRRRLKVQD